jgi:hypothetical protein
MVAHTGFLIFARPIIIDKKRADQKLLLETGAISALQDDDKPIID